MLQRPLIQVVGVALITEFFDHNYSVVEVVLYTGKNLHNTTVADSL